jgi:hypothetical protein
MDSLITAAARALAAGDPLGALNRVALRDDAPAVALRGIAMAQLGDLAPRGVVCVLVNPDWVKTDMGGPGATLTPQLSVTALRRLIEKFGPPHSGRFYNYEGREYRW